MSRYLHPRHLQPGHSVDGFRIVRCLEMNYFDTLFEVEQGAERFWLKLSTIREGSYDPAEWMVPTDRELGCLLRLHHPHIIRLLAASHWPTVREAYGYLLLEGVAGDTLVQWADRTHPTPHQLVVLLDKVCSALEYMHERHVLHRDLSSRAIRVRPSTHEPVLVGFGFADYPMEEQLRHGPLPMGVPRYPSPEALRFNERHGYDPRARYVFQVTDELYALGALLYEVLTQERPTTLSLLELRANAERTRPSPLEVTQGRVPPALSDLTMSLTAPFPVDRPAQVRDVRRVLADLKQRAGPMWHTPFHPAPPREPPAPPFRARVRAALARAAPRLRWRALWSR